MSLITELVSSRKRLKLTQADVAKAAGLSRMTVQRIEAGEIDPRLTTVLEMSRALQLDVVVVPAILRQEVEAFVQSKVRSLERLPAEAAASVTEMVIAPDKVGNGSP
nr:helix-turn-helix transcriptional regulator [uncultured Albidiferax sp.]